MTSASNARLRLIGAAALFSTGGMAIKACSLTGWQIAGLRSGVAAIALLFLLPGARAWPTRKEWLVGFGYALTMVLFVVANKLTTAANAIFLQSTAPLYILLASPWLLGERIVRRDLVFLATMALGLVLFFVDERHASAIATNPFEGNVIALVSGVTWACTVMGLRWLGGSRAREHEAPDPADASRARGARGRGPGALVAGNALSCLVCVPFMTSLASATPADWSIVLYLGVFQIALAYILLTAGLRAVPAFEASVLLLVEPVLSPIWAWIVHGERPGPWAIAGGTILLIATVGKTWWDVRPESRAAASA
jgi:drug/metabolite transporter, DME family